MTLLQASLCNRPMNNEDVSNFISVLNNISCSVIGSQDSLSPSPLKPAAVYSFTSPSRRHRLHRRS